MVVLLDRLRKRQGQRSCLFDRDHAAKGYGAHTSPSPSLGAPWLSLSPSPPPPWGIPPAGLGAAVVVGGGGGGGVVWVSVCVTGGGALVVVGAGGALVVVGAGGGAGAAAGLATGLGALWCTAGWLTGRGFAGLGGVVVVVVVVAVAAARVAVVALLVDELELAEPHPATPRATPKSRTSGRSLGGMVLS